VSVRPPQARSTTIAWLLAFLIAALVVLAAPSATRGADAPSLAYLGTFLQNDNEGLEPTTDAERARLKRTGDEFAAQLADSGRYRIVLTPDDMRAKIAAGQLLGECGGCEADYGRALGADLVAWIRVQKVSNLILNMNVYIADVRSGRMLLTKSVDLRGNTDDSWSRSLRYLVKNSVLTAHIRPSGS
jgi:Protein of unknown function (DUF2380)